MVSQVTFRIDDVSANTNPEEFLQHIEILRKVSKRIIVGINLLSRRALNGSVYPDLPLKNHDRLYFYDVDQLIDLSFVERLRSIPGVEIASHGLLHNSHSKMSRDAVEASIMTSCGLLKSRIFIPPFNEVGQDVISTCQQNGIELVRNEEDRKWRSIENEEFDTRTLFWYYHPWRVSLSKLREVIRCE